MPKRNDVKIQKRKSSGVKPTAAEKTTSESVGQGGVQLQASVRVHQPPEVCYSFWRDFENLPRFMTHVQSVEVMDPIHSHWVIDAPADTTVEWDAEIIEDLPEERISWRSVENAQIANAGSVNFSAEAGGRQTTIKVALTYNPPLGALGQALIELFGESPDEKLADDLGRFKDAIENEEILP